MRINIVFAGVLMCSIALIGCETGGAAKPVHTEPEPEVTFEPPPTVDPMTYYAHGHLLERQGQYERAIDQYQHALEIQPRFVNARNRLGIVLNQLERHPEATAQFRLAIQDAPTSAQLYNNLGFSLYLEGQYKAAIENFKQALEYQPNFTRAEMNLGLSYGKLEQFATALEHFRNAVPEADAQYNVAVLQTTAGDYGGAAGSLEQALTARPEFIEARQQLRDIALKTAQAEARKNLLAAEHGPDNADIDPQMTVEPGPVEGPPPPTGATPRAEADPQPQELPVIISTPDSKPASKPISAAEPETPEAQPSDAQAPDAQAPAPNRTAAEAPNDSQDDSDAIDEEPNETPAARKPLTPEEMHNTTITMHTPLEPTPNLSLQAIYDYVNHDQGPVLAALPLRR